jgi:diacylglycerol O-acyltransferase
VAEAIAHGFKVSASMWATYVEDSGSVWNAYLEMIAHPAKALEYAQMGTGRRTRPPAADERGQPHAVQGGTLGRKATGVDRSSDARRRQAVSHACACSINDLMLATVAGALRGYLEEKGDPTEGIELRATIPVNLRPPGSERDLGNGFGLVAVELPVGVADPMARLREVSRRMAALKKSYEPRVTLGLISALGSAPKVLQAKLFDLLLSRMTAVITNVPGAQKPLYMAGSRWRHAMFWVPQSANIGLGVSILSFDGHLQFGVITDAALVPDPQAIVDRFRSEFVTYAGLTGTTVSAPAAATVEPPPEAARALKPGNPGGKAPRPAAKSPAPVRVKAVGTKRSPKAAPIN